MIPFLITHETFAEINSVICRESFNPLYDGCFMNGYVDERREIIVAVSTSFDKVRKFRESLPRDLSTEKL